MYAGLPCLSSRAGGSHPTLEPEAPGDPGTFRNDASVQRLASDKTVLLKAAVKGYVLNGGRFLKTKSRYTKIS